MLSIHPHLQARSSKRATGAWKSRGLASPLAPATEGAGAVRIEQISRGGTAGRGRQGRFGALTYWAKIGEFKVA